ncbi:coagulation factor XIII A chain-like [Phyllopteryx taeniolatus]|uniref:coagulation factor XIII A chain-like n=1 Tax=Phyllopteryx taeniolatus TaxID=161469 RepID=UPI002AD37C8C|nr:coagulation factor XIII A chain-like [Phyllopteryx taeniolatus]
MKIEFLDIWDVDMKKRDETNKILDHTALYHSENLIVQRGQEFQVNITFNRLYNPNKDKFAVELVIVSNPQYSKNTYVPVFSTEDRQSSWPGRVIRTSDVLTVVVMPAANCIVGKYQMYAAEANLYGIRTTKRYKSRYIYVHVNPWEAVAFLNPSNAERKVL